MSHALHFLHPMAAETALATVNTEAGLDYWLPGDAHQELQHVQDGRHPAASSPAPPPCSPWPGPSRPCRGLDLWKSRGASGRCLIYLHSLDILLITLFHSYLQRPSCPVKVPFGEQEGWRLWYRKKGDRPAGRHGIRIHIKMKRIKTAYWFVYLRCIQYLQ